MLDPRGFDLWANGYDASVGLSEESNAYPFAGYKRVLGDIFARVMAAPGRCVLDLGFGTGTLTTKLYEAGCTIYGQDFSPAMIALAQPKMPGAHLYQGDFTCGLANALLGPRYDAIISTYALHHLEDAQKVPFLQRLLPLLAPGGCIYIGDVAFPTRAALEAARAAIGEEWDDEERYFAVDELAAALPGVTFTAHSFCAGVIAICP